MGEGEPNDRQTQTTPKGASIPVPTRDEVLRDLAKVAKPAKPSVLGDDGEGGAEGE
jgi:hypothetical protein